MNATEIFNKLSMLRNLSERLENAYVENGGEVTNETETLEGEISSIRELLAGDAIDDLGRWLRSKEDEIAALKAEKNYIARRIDSVDGTIDYIKSVIYKVLKEMGVEKAKGANGYSFTPMISRSVSADKTALNERYLEKAQQAVHDAGIPDYVGISLTASSKLVPEGEDLPDVFSVKEAETVKFLKPRGGKE